jgi:hypothetical protein
MTTAKAIDPHAARIKALEQMASAVDTSFRRTSAPCLWLVDEAKETGGDVAAAESMRRETMAKLYEEKAQIEAALCQARIYETTPPSEEEYVAWVAKIDPQLLAMIQ